MRVHGSKAGDFDTNRLSVQSMVLACCAVQSACRLWMSFRPALVDAEVRSTETLRTFWRSKLRHYPALSEGCGSSRRSI